ncbi:MAG: hypothetical protein IT233_01670 [Bacteroidia bacterium]|nr:hypothetical protein [Bacteroidia bacterium]
MQAISPHTFHIPVMGLGYTVDTPVKVARFGINSVVSIIQDQLLEQMRKYYLEQRRESYEPIPGSDPDHRWKRVREYLDLLKKMVDEQLNRLRMEPFEEGREIMKYFRMLPSGHELRERFMSLLDLTGNKRKTEEDALREFITPGSIDVNIMTKIDSPAFDREGKVLPYEYSLAAAALKGFGMSTLRSSVVLSAGMNPRLYSFITGFDDFFPDKNGKINKRIILKVSDFRSADIQGRFLAKKGIWVSEFRVESGLNCGGHAFPTNGLLLGPILEEFLAGRERLQSELFRLCNESLKTLGKPSLAEDETIRLSVQGGIGTSAEDNLLREYYGADSTGWGSPFLLVPEATNVDRGTIADLNAAKPEDYFISHASPLGVPFHNFRKSSGQKNLKERIQAGRPGSPCYLRFLSFNTEYTDKPICVSSRQYLHEKSREIQSGTGSETEKQNMMREIEEKECLCEGLSVTALLCNNIPVPHNLEAVTICPGPNLAYFSGTYTLEEMVDHIYGRKAIPLSPLRPHFFEKEFSLYKNYMEQSEPRDRKGFTENLAAGVEYYNELKKRLSHSGLKGLNALTFNAAAYSETEIKLRN